MDTRHTKLCTLCNTLIFMLGIILGRVCATEHNTVTTVLIVGVSTLAFYLMQSNPIKFLYRKIK
jgi:hypothetical protein